MASVRINGAKITDWASFHQIFKETCGFPDFYGMNMNAWIDCLSDLRAEYGMTQFQLANDEILYLEIHGALDLSVRLPEIISELVESTAFVNSRYLGYGQTPPLAIIFIG
ncbi:barnase inhibitor [Capsulimonas corticalis]|uniref:Barnase inhibitor n=1 Tax=Capsulimonas corticalis TaxID=2219043 RepID=A0A402D1B3_9BACT|nr:barstar family protein [Capsulimonas corticalis]BDI31668.1 barnase inhibitor [Capsulimonas corticalis]